VKDFINRGRENWALIASAGPENGKLAIFVHGFLGGYLSTWGRIPDFLRARAETDPVLMDWDFLFLGYSTHDIGTYLDIASLIWTKWAQASSGEPPFAHGYHRFALFGHSLGTLGIRQALCASLVHGPQFIDSLRSVTLFGTPLNGSRLAHMAAIFYRIGEALKPENPQLRMLKVWSQGSHLFKPWPQVRLVLGHGDWVVGHQFAELIEWPGDGVPSQETLDHSDLVKLDAWTNCAVMDYIRAGLGTK
jgi:hypothetical protein